MSRELDYKIAKWLGWKYEEYKINGPQTKEFWWTDPRGHYRFEIEIPHYEDSGVAAELIPFLNEKYKDRKYKIMLENHPENNTWYFTVLDAWNYGKSIAESGWCNSIGEAICIGIEQLIDKEL